MMMRLWHFSPGINVDWCQFRLWDGNVWVSQHLSGPWLSPDNGCFDTPWFVQKQQNTEEDQKKPQTSILDWGLSGKTWNNDVFLAKRITIFLKLFQCFTNAELIRGPSCSICLEWSMVSIKLRKWRTSAASSPSWSFVLWCGRPTILIF